MPTLLLVVIHPPGFVDMSVAPKASRRAAPDPQIVHPLDRLRGLVRRFVLLDGLLAAALFVVAWFWLGLGIDFGLFKLTTFDWVLETPWALRGLTILLFLGLLFLIVLTRVVLRWLRDFSYTTLALVLEKRFPKLLGDRLITAVELADVKRAGRLGYSQQMLRQTIDEARERVGQVPVSSVFKWSRLWWRVGALVGIMAVMVVGSYLVFALVAKRYSPLEFAWRFGDVAMIWGERNILLRDTPWPRRAHLELIDFPEKELRVAKDDRAPKVRVRAYEWVHADRTVREGWRPLLWSDVQELVPDAPPSVAVREEGDWPAHEMAKSAVMGVSTLPGEKPVAVRSEALAGLTADEVAKTHGANAELTTVFEKLAELAAKPSMSRTLRRLAVPDAVTLTYKGRPFDYGAAGKVEGNTRGEFKLSREPNGDYSAEVTGLKEPVTFVVRAEDFRTAPRDIFLVPPPMLIRLTHTDAEPAYLHHPPPVDGAAGSQAEFAALKGLRQALAEKDLSLTGERTLCSVKVGTEVVLTATADKPLRSVHVQPRRGQIPGTPPGSTAPLAIPVNGDTFTFQFAGTDRIKQAEPIEFEFVLEDNDGVKASRAVVIQASDDQAPQVELAVDVLRKVGNTYLCTASARVPFVKDSMVRDDAGLARVEYQFTVTKLEATAVVGLQAQAISGVWAFAPIAPNLGTALGPTASAFVAGQLSQGGQKQFAVMPVAAFEQAFGAIPRDTPIVLNQKLGTAIGGPEFGRVVKEVKFAFDTDVFDLDLVDRVLEKRGKPMKVTAPGEVQSRFRIDLDIVATDTNVESGPKTGRNLDPIRLLVVSEADLLAEITKDEEGLIGKLDDALRKLTDAQLKLTQTTDRLISPEPPADILLSAKVRAEDVIQDVAKGRDNTQVVSTEYARLKREVEYNRVAEERDSNGNIYSKVGKGYQDRVIGPLDELLRKEFKATEDALATFRDPLLDGRRPDDQAMLNARNNLVQLITELRKIRDRLGEALSISKLRDDLRKLIEAREAVSLALDAFKKRQIAALLAPRIEPVGTVILAKGGKAKVKHATNWNLFVDDLKVTIQPPANGGVTGPGDVIVKPDTDVEYELTAGDKPGDYVIKVIPALGEPVEVKVTVR